MNDLWPTSHRTMGERIGAYRRAYPDWPAPRTYGDPPKLDGQWVIGNNYARINERYGAFPPTFVPRALTMFSERPLMHLFSGGMDFRDEDDVVCVDCDPAMPADLCCESEKLHTKPELEGQEFMTVLADPPYNRAAAEEYGQPWPNKRLTIKSVSHLVAPGGHLLWLDTSMPLWAKSDGWRWRGLITVFCGTNRVLRGLFVLKKVT